MKKLFLICNAHIDPVWQWQKEEGSAVAITTFSAAADFCEQYDGFVFNHNESLLYEWVEEYAPELFERICRLISAGKWHVMGGWYLQPDCNMPSGESIVRQILRGQTYFQKKFNVSPKIAVNFDSFGHSVGLVQILADAGYDGYICTRPMQELKQRDFVWKGFNGSELLLHRCVDGYNTLMGHAAERAEQYYKYFSDTKNVMMMWGVGNHGGGPSRCDIAALKAFAETHPDVQVIHTTPKEYFMEIKKECRSLPVQEGSLAKVFPGCYTSQIRIKQAHQKAENELYLTEKMLAHAAVYGLRYDKKSLERAEKDILLCEFHDVLPGTMIKEAEEVSLGQLGHALEELSVLKLKSFYYLAGGEKRAERGEYPVLVYNPHPYDYETTIECELMLADQNHSLEYIYVPRIVCEGREILCQLEKESSNIPTDWRKKIVFRAKLKANVMNRFSCFMERVLREEYLKTKVAHDGLSFRSMRRMVTIGKDTGLIESYIVDGEELITGEGCRIDCIKGSCDPWGFHYDQLKEKLGSFRLMTERECADFAAVKAKTLSPVRIVERGPVRSIVEAFFVYKSSKAVVRYTIAEGTTEIGIDIRMFNQESDMIFRLVFPTAFKGGTFVGKTCFGVQELEQTGDEVCAQDWVCVGKAGKALILTHFGNYGFSIKDGELNVTLLQSAAYTAHPLWEREILPQDRFSPRIDVGERVFHFVLDAGNYTEKRTEAERKSVEAHQGPMIMNFFPTGEGRRVPAVLRTSNKNITVSTLKRAENGRGMILRLFNGTDTEQKGDVEFVNANKHVVLPPNGFISLRTDGKRVSEVNVLEKKKV